MKKTIVYLFLMSTMLLYAPSAAAQGVLGFLKDVGKAAVSLLVGAAESHVGSAIPEEHKDTYNDIVSSINSGFGVDDSYARAGSNWQEGKKNDAIFDMVEGVASSTGTSGTFVVRTILDVGRAQNNYQKNIASGMSVDEASAIRNEELGAYAEGIYTDYMMSDAEREAMYRYDQMQYDKNLREQDRALLSEIWHELLNRGYSSSEASVYMAIIEENPGLLSGLYSEADNSIYMTGIMLTEDTNVQNMIKERAKKALDNLNIANRTGEIQSENNPQDGGEFFGTKLTPDIPAENMPESPSPVKPIDPIVPETPKTPVDPSADAKARLKEIAPDRYLLNHVGLNKMQQETLDEVASLLNKYPNIRIRLCGNTCDLGTEYINGLIATKRANHAKDYLVKKGVDASRIEVESNASASPVTNGHTGEDRLQNRRVTISIIDDVK